jgi:prephenate dehydratase
MKIAIQGELGSFSHQAALVSVPKASIAPCMLSAEAFEQLVKGRVDALVIPIENTLAGSVVEHFDLLREHAVHIESETLIRIQHHVIGTADSDIASVQRIYSHPVALAQCRAFFREHPGIEPMAFYDTAGAVKQIVQLRDRHSAAIAGIQAADIYGGKVLLRAVEDDPANFTRFLLVRAGAASASLEGLQKLSLCCELEHRPGGLAAMLAAIAEVGGNVSLQQSRPVHGHPWHYHFFLDVILPDLAPTQRLMEQLPSLCESYRVLGRFVPSAEFLESTSESSFEP